MASSVTLVAIVIHPFGGHNKGDVISDPATLTAIEQSSQKQFVVFSRLPAASAETPEEVR